MDKMLLKNDEKAVFALRSLYEKYGYSQFKMSKFEEYDLYVRNKDFLVSDNIITFTDTNGKLMALKPDVTLSIIKNSDDHFVLLLQRVGDIESEGVVAAGVSADFLPVYIDGGDLIGSANVQQDSAAGGALRKWEMSAVI